MKPIDFDRWKDERFPDPLDSPLLVELCRLWREADRLAKATQLDLPFEDIQLPLAGLLRTVR